MNDLPNFYDSWRTESYDDYDEIYCRSCQSEITEDENYKEECYSSYTGAEFFYYCEKCAKDRK